MIQLVLAIKLVLGIVQIRHLAASLQKSDFASLVPRLLPVFNLHAENGSAWCSISCDYYVCYCTKHGRVL